MFNKKIGYVFGMLVIIIALILLFSLSFNSEEVIKLGVALPLTGEVASWGENALAGIKLATNEINTNGGINGKKIELIVEDSKCTSESVNVYSKLIYIDKVSAILGPICSSEAEPAIEIANNAKIPNIMITASAPNLTLNKKHILRVYPSDTLQGKFAADYIYNVLGKKTVAVIYINLSWGTNVSKVFVENYEALGGKVMYFDKVNAEQMDLKDHFVKIKKLNPEVIYAPVYPKNILGVYKTMDELDLNIILIAGDSIAGEEVISSGLGNNTFFTLPIFNLPDSYIERINSMQEYSNLNVSFASPLGYDAANVLYNSIQNKKENQDLIDVLLDANYLGITYDNIAFDSQGDLTTTKFEVKQIQNKQAITYYKG